jgi:hypothetical protein
MTTGEPQWVFDSKGKCWSKLRYERGQGKFVYTRGDTEVTLRKGAKVMCTNEMPPGPATEGNTPVFPGYNEWAKTQPATTAAADSRHEVEGGGMAAPPALTPSEWRRPRPPSSSDGARGRARCPLCDRWVVAEHIAEHFTRCFDEHSPRPAAAEDAFVAMGGRERTQARSVAVHQRVKQADASQEEVALFDESALGVHVPSSVIALILQPMDMSTLVKLGIVNRGWRKACRTRCRVRCAHEVSQLARLLPARHRQQQIVSDLPNSSYYYLLPEWHRQIVSDYLGRTPAAQCRGVYRLEQQLAQGCWAAEVFVYVKHLNGRFGGWRVRSTAEAQPSTQFGVLGAICVGDLHDMIHQSQGTDVNCILLLSTSTFRPALHSDVPLMFYATPKQRGNVVSVEFNVLMRTRSMVAFEAVRNQRQKEWRQERI